jgi:glucose/arabinose dehydrogenase
VRSSQAHNNNKLKDHHLELVAEGFSFPTSLTFNKDGTFAYIAESGLPFGGNPAGGRIWEISLNKNNKNDGTDDIIDVNEKRSQHNHHLLVTNLRPPVNGLTYHNHHLYVSEGDHPGRILCIDPSIEYQCSSNHETATAGVYTVLDNLPGPGNYHTNMVAFDLTDGKLYFSQGALTNTGIVGLDAYELGWLRRLPHAHDIPGFDIVLAGVNITTPDPLANDDSNTEKTQFKKMVNSASTTATTGAFVPFGTRTPRGQRIKSQLPCSAAIMRCDPDGSNLELVAWGLRNAYGIGFLPDGRLLATDQGADDRGSRPVGNAPDLLYYVRKDAWYGWPDFIGGEPITDPKYAPKRGGTPLTFVLANHEELPPPEKPLLRFPPNVAAVKFDVAPSNIAIAGNGFSFYDQKIDDNHHPGKEREETKDKKDSDNEFLLFVALFGDEKPMTAPPGPRVGRAILCIDPSDWTIVATIRNQALSRPIDLRYNYADGCLYILDFGKFEINEEHHINAQSRSGKLWRLALPIEFER